MFIRNFWSGDKMMRFFCWRQSRDDNVLGSVAGIWTKHTRSLFVNVEFGRWQRGTSLNRQCAAATRPGTPRPEERS